MKLSRRDFIHQSIVTAGWFASSNLLASSTKESATSGSFLADISPLQAADDNGIMLPAGFSSRVIATSGKPVLPDSDFKWPYAPDGGACFAAEGGGWIYVCNAELPNAYGGVSAIAFNRDGSIRDAYPILEGSNRNCAGGKTPWGSWLSCEEVPDGLVYECDPTGKQSATVLPALGRFNHEAVVYEEKTHFLYLTEDRPDGGFYRFIPEQKRADGFGDLSSGKLQIAQISDPSTGSIKWHDIKDPSGKSAPTRYQVTERTGFNGGEGMDILGDKIFFTTKGDNRLWVYNSSKESIAIVYDDDTSKTPILTGVDNVHINAFGDILVAEDGGDMQIVVITTNGEIKPLLQIPGQRFSEITGPAFSPDQTRLYFNSQRGKTGQIFDGITYEITGPFFKA